MTFSAPKSVSLLWAFATEPVAEVVAGAHREAVAESLGFLEQRAAVARVQAQWRAPAGGDRGLGGGGVRAPHQPRGRPPIAHPLLGPEPRETQTATAATWPWTPALCSTGAGRRGLSTRRTCSGP